ncbi:MAG: methionyl-tRNA formyltransferase [Burkholderiales bacterium]|nr:methionyl-tRNA formyltransferase [Burkholderiales bacterium]
MALRIGYFGHGPWSHRALQKILRDPKFEVCFVATRSVGDRVLERLAGEGDIPFFVPGPVNTPYELARLEKFSADLFVSMSFDQIFKKGFIALPKKGVVNCHAGALPYYRGRNVLNWALINGERRFGVTAHYIDNEGIDTGPIIQQDFVDIDPNDGYGELLEKAYDQCPETLFSALMKISNGVLEVKQQTVIDAVGLYCGKRRPGDEWLDWGLSSVDIHNFIRGVTLPAPCARTRLAEQTYAVVKSELIQGAKIYRGTNGEVVGREASAIVVKTGDSVLKVLKTALVDDKGQMGPIETASLPVGSRFDPYFDQRLEQLESRLRNLENLMREESR